MRTPPRRPLVAAAALALAAVALSGCHVFEDPAPTAAGERGTQTGSLSDSGEHPAASSRPRLTVNVQRGAQQVPVSTLVSVATSSGTLSHVSVTSGAGTAGGTASSTASSTVAGALAPGGRTWTARERLAPDTTYTVQAQATNGSRHVTRTTRFHTQALTLAQQTYPSVAPLAGQTVGVGMPVVVTFDVPVTNRRVFEENMHVTSTPAQPGSWHWLSSTLVHWRPATYWKPHTQVHVDLDLAGVPAGNGVYGQLDKHLTFHVGDSHVYRVNARTDQMRVFSNGRLLRTLPITTGKPGYTTRSGTKVIIEKFPSIAMNSETVGIGGSEAYDLPSVLWAMRMTFSGEFIHAAPWSVADQGHSNVSHGCTGMSTADAAWLYRMTHVGDVVITTGTDKHMTLDNGYGDWNESFAQWKRGSAL